jgi:hypothetical protein
MALPIATNSYAVTDPSAGSGIIYIVADPQTVGGNASVIPWARIVSLAGDNADLAALVARIGLLASDAQARANFGGSFGALLNPSGTVDAPRSLAASGGGLGVQAVGGASFASSSTTAGGSLSTSAVAPTTIFSSSEVGAKRRALIIGSSLTAVLTISVWCQTGNSGGTANATAYHTLLTMPAGSVTNQAIIVTSAGAKPMGLVAGTLSTAPTMTTDGTSEFDAPLVNFTVKASVASAATGNLWLDYLALT